MNDEGALLWKPRSALFLAQIVVEFVTDAQFGTQ